MISLIYTQTVALRFKSHNNLSWNKKFRHENMLETRKQFEEEIRVKNHTFQVHHFYIFFPEQHIRDIGTAQSNNRALCLWSITI
jgi:hypothetical protein